VTHDVPDPIIDSLMGFDIPLCYTHSNPSKYCSLSGFWNNDRIYPPWPPGLSIFRHFIEQQDTVIHNWMLDLFLQFPPVPPWDMYSLNLDGLSDWSLMLFCNDGEGCQRFDEGSRVLLATMTFKVEDTMTICLDTCRYQPWDQFLFVRSDGEYYIPRDNMPYCFSLSYPAVGDANVDGVIDLGDVLFLVSYLYKGGPAPYPLAAGDCNCDGTIDLGDLLYLVAYLYKGGPAPSC